MQGDADWLVTDAEVNIALGAELRSAREAAGLSRPQFVAQLPFKTTVPTVLNWELGHRAISYAKLEACRTPRSHRTGPAAPGHRACRVDPVAVGGA